MSVKEATARKPINARALPKVSSANVVAMKRLSKRAAPAANLLKLMANEKRLLILCHLASHTEMSAGDLAETVKLSQSALSQHLAKLRTDGIVTYRRASQTIHYRIADKSALRVLSLLKDIYAGEAA